MEAYEYATRAHAPANDGETWPPLCGLSSASRNPLDAEPITTTATEFEELPADVTCWQCRSILG